MSVVVGVIGTLLSAAGSLKQGQAAADAATANANAARQNAELAQKQGEQVEYQKQEQLKKIGQKERATIAAQRVAGAASGQDVNFGSAADLQEGTAVLAQGDKDNTEYNAALQKWGFDSQSAIYNSQAKQYDKQAADAKTAGMIGAVTSLASGAYTLSGGVGKGAADTGKGVFSPTPQADFFGNNYGTVAPKWYSAKDSFLKTRWF